jgi:hypothetical protein
MTLQTHSTRGTERSHPLLFAACTCRLAAARCLACARRSRHYVEIARRSAERKKGAY